MLISNSKYWIIQSKILCRPDTVLLGNKPKQVYSEVVYSLESILGDTVFVIHQAKLVQVKIMSKSAEWLIFNT